jgi:hypothetical protein
MPMSETDSHDLLQLIFLAAFLAVWISSGTISCRVEGQGGTLLGVKSESMDVLAYSFGEFHIQVSYL